VLHEVRVLGRLSETGREWHGATQRLAGSLRKAPIIGVSKSPGAMVTTRMPLGRQFARNGQRESHDAPLSGGVDQQANLTVEGRD